MIRRGNAQIWGIALSGALMIVTAAATVLGPLDQADPHGAHPAAMDAAVLHPVPPISAELRIGNHGTVSGDHRVVEETTAERTANET